jgi:aryl-alcohol dehydrogenase-like predicted oxidoreductase
VTLFDTANIYGDGRSERYLGRALGANRNKVLIATKFGLTEVGQKRANATRGHVLKAAEGSLRRLRTNYIDIYQVHFPDPDTPVDETLSALERLVQQGKVRIAGCSNYSARRLRSAGRAASRLGIDGFRTAQNEYSLLNRRVERFVLPEVKEQSLGFFAYYPLASGLLTGKYGSGEMLPADSRLALTPELAARPPGRCTRQKLLRLNKLALQLDRPLLELALGFVASRGEVSSVLVGATTPDQVIQNAKAISHGLRNDELMLVDRATSNH